MFNVREIFPKSGGLKSCAGHVFCFWGLCSRHLACLNQASIASSEQNTLGFSLLLGPCGPRSLYTARALSTACSPDYLSRSAPKTLSALALARPLRPLSCALRNLLFMPETGLSAILSPCTNSKVWALAFTAGCPVEEDDVELFGVQHAAHLQRWGASRSRMLLGTRPYQVGSDEGFSIADASRNPTLPGRQRWGLLNRACCQERKVQDERHAGRRFVRVRGWRPGTSPLRSEIIWFGDSGKLI